MKKAAFVLLGLLLLICSSVKAEEDRVVARISEKAITASQFEQILNLYDARRRRQMDRNPQFKRSVLEKYVEGIVLSKKAREKNLDALPEVKDKIEMMTNEILAQAYVQKEIVEKIAFSEDDVRRYYESHQGEFTRPEAVNVRQVFIGVDASSSVEMRNKAKAEAESIRKKLEQGENFASLTGQFSENPETKEKGHSLGFVTRGRLAPELDKVVFSLQPGQISKVIETPQGYYIMKVDGKREAVIEPFDTVKDHIREKALLDLKTRSINEFRAKAMKEAAVQFYLDPRPGSKSETKDGNGAN